MPFQAMALSLTLAGEKVIRRNNGSLLGVVDGSAISISHRYNEKGAFPLTNFQFTAGQKSLVFKTDSSRIGILSPDGSRLFQRNHGMLPSPRFISVANGLPTRIPLQCRMICSSASSSFPKPAAIWLDNETILMSQTNSKLVTVTIGGEVDEIVTIPELDLTDPTEEGFGLSNPTLAISYSLYRDPVENIVYDAGGLGDFAIDVVQRSYAPYQRHKISNEFSATQRQFGYTYGENNPDILYQSDKIGKHEARQRIATSSYLALNDHENRFRWWTTKSLKWEVSHLHVDTLIDWVDYREPSKEAKAPSLGKPARVGPLIVHEWGVQVIGESSIKIDDPKSM